MENQNTKVPKPNRRARGEYESCAFEASARSGGQCDGDGLCERNLKSTVLMGSSAVDDNKSVILSQVRSTNHKAP